MEKNIGFKVTVEFYCNNMISEKYLNEAFKGIAWDAYRYISDDFSDSPLNFSDRDEIVKIEIIKN